MKPLLFALTVAGCLAVNLQARTWTSTDGKTMEAEFVSSDGPNVTIRRSDGQTFTLSLDQFSKADREFVSQQMTEPAVQKEEDKIPEVTGEIRDPKEGEKVPREFSVSGRTRGAPKGFVTMLFRGDTAEEGSFFPHYEFSDANRSFSTYVYHRQTDGGQWNLHLYVLPEEDAEKLAAWHRKASALVESGQENKIEPFDSALTKDAIHVTSVKYALETN